METRTVIVAVVTAAVLSLAGRAAGQEITYSGSLQVSTGDYYFTERTNSAYLSNGLSLKTGALRISASLPVIWQSSPWVSHARGGVVPTGGTQQDEVGDRLGERGRDRDGTGPGPSAARARAGTVGDTGGAVRAAAVRAGRIVLEDTTGYEEVGVGDPVFRAELDLTPGGPTRWSVALAGEVKPSLADPDRGFGTGAWDGGVDLSVTRRLSSTFLFASVGYQVLGDMEELELKDPLTYAAGLGFTRPGATVGLLASVSGSTRILENTDPPLQIGAGMNLRTAPGRNLGANVALGLTESSPDVSVAVGWTLEL